MFYIWFHLASMGWNGLTVRVFVKRFNESVWGISIKFMNCRHVIFHSVNSAKHFVTNGTDCLSLVTALMMGEWVPMSETLATYFACEMRGLHHISFWCLQSRKVCPETSIWSPLSHYRKENPTSILFTNHG